MTVALYNEIDPYAAQWLRNLRDAGHIAPGEVITDDIRRINPLHIEHTTQAHFFAGIGVWSYAFRLAGWPDDRPVWSGSCPCQPFSAAGRKKKFDDDRHLWPDWFKLIRECRPPVIFGEQVASPDGLLWLDAVYADLEGAGYAVAPFDLSAAGVGAPHIRQRLYFVAIAAGTRLKGAEERGEDSEDAQGWARRMRAAGDRAAGELAVPGLERREGVGLHLREREPRPSLPEASGSGAAGVVGNAGREGGRRDAGAVPGAQGEGESERGGTRDLADVFVASGATRGFWARADWIYCRDGKYRPVEPGSFPLAHGAPARMGRLRAYGNAIAAPLAATFVRCVMDILP